MNNFSLPTPATTTALVGGSDRVTLWPWKKIYIRVSLKARWGASERVLGRTHLSERNSPLGHSFSLFLSIPDTKTTNQTSPPPRTKNYPPPSARLAWVLLSLSLLLATLQKKWNDAVPSSHKKHLATLQRATCCFFFFFIYYSLMPPFFYLSTFRLLGYFITYPSNIPLRQIVTKNKAKLLPHAKIPPSKNSNGKNTDNYLSQQQIKHR